MLAMLSVQPDDFLTDGADVRLGAAFEPFCGRLFICLLKGSELVKEEEW